MGRYRQKKSLGVWLNGERVGTWAINSSGVHEFHYIDSWLNHEQSRPISLSLPLADIDYIYRGSIVSSFFENLLPDSSEIRQRIKNRYRAASLSAFDLLTEIGRDCVGALQILPEDSIPLNSEPINGRPLDEHEIANILKGLVNKGLGQSINEEEFRISLAGAQEKTALLYYQNQWFVPYGATPSTHILKLPLGKIGGIGLDITGSVENEWLCSKIAYLFGLDTAVSEVVHFEDITVLVVNRFDRRFVNDNSRILRIPQEDFCQITGTPPSNKYEADGGPGITSIMKILLGSRNAISDRENFFRAQVLFMLLAAPDGHGKNFSVFIERGGRFRLTPFYDIISAYPVLGYNANNIAPEKLKMAMAFTGKNKHYEWNKIKSRHILETARLCGWENQIDSILNDFVQKTPRIIVEVSASLPSGFPGSIAEPILGGLEHKVKTLSELN